MKRLHVHVSVENLAASIRFYSAVFATEPVVVKSDYAKWMLDDPRANFAISTRGSRTGLNHLGIQVETPEELQEVYARLQHAERPVFEEGQTICCYARSEKAWISDPQGLRWETFRTYGDSTTYGNDPDPESIRVTVESSALPKTSNDSCCASKQETANRQADA
ncbi:glyoxalase/bleomycin resistance/dioxygenase family protein [Acidiphilium sp. AL]|uniref:ArsI/CadI family heavy metal resistance metalloenzyme n=1 Tax=Acidiphilium sp. AL TaxID=2871704 RepID=UPI0021CB763A|nr:ArsI/CadI family heavy metal resistance metalloenzyme [Acidiphilium sp. AL]MCU4160667.1 glyoxalase/bleomycin resistance/dioxygenase family protein [Acidiphilium sp. AL]